MREAVEAALRDAQLIRGESKQNRPLPVGPHLRRMSPAIPQRPPTRSVEKSDQQAQKKASQIFRPARLSETSAARVKKKSLTKGTHGLIGERVYVCRNKFLL
ncbi:hypothetical protein [Silvibacterium sp.]|uniref:hypothetical protein n=1 Tax=Silvibacterium sp. TaxID=1964179 RepID=UPI0039E60343